MEKYIKDYLLKYSQVQLSGFGVFKVTYKASYIHPILHTFSVPGKYVVFSENKIQDDDFAFFVTKKEKITMEMANNRIENWIQEIWKTIKDEKKHFDVSTLGSFFINAMGRIEFASILDTDISPQSFGLEEFEAKLPAFSSVQPIPEIKPVQPIPEETEDEIFVENEGYEEQSDKPKKKKRLGLWIFLFIFLLSGASVGVVYFAFPDTFTTCKDKTVDCYTICKDKTVDCYTACKDKIVYWYNKFIKKDSRGEIPDETIDDTIEDTPDETIDEVIDEKPSQEFVPIDTVVKQPIPDPPVQVNSEHYHYVIIGSFQESANADKFLKQKQADYDNIVNLGAGNSGYYLIGIGPYSKQEAEIKRKEIPHAWVFSKKR